VHGSTASGSGDIRALSHRHHPRLSGVVIPSGEEEEEEEDVRQKTMTERVNLALVYVYTAKSCTLVPFVTN